MEKHFTSRSFRAFDTVCTVGCLCEDEAVLDEAQSLCMRYELLFSPSDYRSDVCRVNGAYGRATKVDPETARLAKAALSYCEETDGLFDVTMGELARLWNYHVARVPSDLEVSRALAHVDWRRVRVDEAASTIAIDNSDAYLTLGGIAKGYIADQVVSLLASHGVSSALVNLGGNVAVLGSRPDGSPWRIAVETPGEKGVPAAVVPLRNASMVTSGIYERVFWVQEGNAKQMHHHIADPRTGYPAQSDLASATVVARRSIDADGYSTALLIMGLDDATAFVEGKRGIEAFFITRSGETRKTSGLEGFCFR